MDGRIKLMQKNGSLSTLGSIPLGYYGDLYQMNRNSIIITLKTDNCLVSFNRNLKNYSTFSGKCEPWNEIVDSMDGFISNATYVSPNGMSHHNQSLFVTENYTKKIRRISFVTKFVSTHFKLLFNPTDILIVKDTWIIPASRKIWITNVGLLNLSELHGGGFYVFDMINVTDNIVLIAGSLQKVLRVLDLRTQTISTFRHHCGKSFSPEALAVAHGRIYITHGIELFSLYFEDNGK